MHICDLCVEHYDFIYDGDLFGPVGRPRLHGFQCFGRDPLAEMGQVGNRKWFIPKTWAIKRDASFQICPSFDHVIHPSFWVSRIYSMHVLLLLCCFIVCVKTHHLFICSGGNFNDSWFTLVVGWFRFSSPSTFIGGGFNDFLFLPRKLGKISILTNTFQMG